MTTMDENIMQRKLTHLLLIFPLNMNGPFSTSLVKTMPKKTTGEIGCRSFDQPNVQSLNRLQIYLFHFLSVL